MNLRIRIEQTDFFKKLSPNQREITIKRANRLELENAYAVATNIGYDKWEKQSRYNYIHIGIVKELIEQDQVSKQ